MEEFIQTVTPESFLNDCENFGIKLEEDKIEKEFMSQEIVNYTKEHSSFFSNEDNSKYCTAA